MYDDLEAVNQDAAIFVKFAQRFRFLPNTISVYKQAGSKQYKLSVNQLRKDCKMTPNELVFILCLFASHGMIRDGRQVILVNEYDKTTGFYNLLGVEENIRMAARMSSNSYYVSIFACCREIFLVTEHSGGISLLQLRDLEQQKKLRDKRRLE